MLDYNTISKFVIEPEEAKAMAKAAGLASVSDLLPLLIPATLRLARTPISNFPVGSAGLGASGRIYLGVNLEFENLPLNYSIHSEQFLVTNAAQHGETQILKFAVSAVPCGHCRQFLQELRNAGRIEILVTSGSSAGEFRPLSELLPDPFGPADLLCGGEPFLLEPHHNDIVMEMEGRVVEAAVGAARGAHAPYSGWAAGFAVGDGKGRVWAGGSEESAAFNPSMGPVAAAMVAVVAGGGEVEGIEEAVLVEGEGAAVRYEAAARVFLEAVAPAARFRVCRFRGKGNGR